MTAETFEDDVFKHALETSCEELIAEAYQRGRKEALEEAAKVAEDYPFEPIVRNSIAEQIRSLMEKEDARNQS